MSHGASHSLQRGEAGRYPLPFSGELQWRANGATQAEIALPPLPARHLVVPSFASPESPDHRWALDCGDASSLTASFGRPAGQCPHFDGAPALNARIDCFETSRAVPEARLRLRVAAREPPRDYLVVVGVRPITMAVGACAMRDTPVLDVPGKSQMDFAQEDLRGRICSPTCVSMAMDHLGIDHALPELVIAAHHRATDLYGVWPQNLWAASRWGAIGAVEVAADSGVIGAAIAGRHPLAASIAFAAGDLCGSAVPASDGHLVIVRGIQNNQVVVNDPAASDVLRHYDATQFLQAWLADRGACYLFAAPRPAQTCDT